MIISEIDVLVGESSRDLRGRAAGWLELSLAPTAPYSILCRGVGSESHRRSALPTAGVLANWAVDFVRKCARRKK